MKEQELEKEIRNLDKQLAKQNFDKSYHNICKLKYELNEIYNRKAEYTLCRLKSNFYEGGEKCGKLQARQLKLQDTSNNIPMIKMGNRVVTSAKQINKV